VIQGKLDTYEGASINVVEKDKYSIEFNIKIKDRKGY
jgi:hypothetical protein